VSIIDSKGFSIANWDMKSLDKILRRLPFRQIDENRWLDRRTDDIYNKDELLQKVIFEFPELADDFKTKEFPQFSKIPKIYFISAQRLLRPISESKIRRTRDAHFHIDIGFDREAKAFANTIEEYAKELCNNIRNILAESSQTEQSLNSTYPHRLFAHKKIISEEEFNQRFEKIKNIQKLLNQYDLYDIEEDNDPTYTQDDAKALSVYIDDTEKKLAIFSDVIEKLKTFIDILNERRFTFKKIAISKEDGFKFTTDKKLPLALGDLSSGEQQEVVLLYELLFKVKAGTLVLIDEPELSLHVVWQKQFLDDLFKIIELQKINIVVATHSPQIVDNRWDLEVDLEVLHNASASK
jgi:predicted ATPase